MSDCLLILCKDGPRKGLPFAEATLLEIDLSGQRVGENLIILNMTQSRGYLASQDQTLPLSLFSLNPPDRSSDLGHRLLEVRPVYILRRVDDVYLIYSVILGFAETMIFLRAGSIPYKDSPEIKTLVKSATEVHMKHQMALGNHDAYYKKYHPDNEIEFKLNMDPKLDIWSISKRFYAFVDRGDLQGFILQPLDGFNEWEFDNYLFEVVAPESDRGYVSFITCPNNEYVVKQKIYQNDALERIERRTKNVRLGNATMEEYLAANYPRLSFKRRPPFGRRRYDINLESLVTGNIYSIMFDNCWLLDDSGYTLTQCEIEYLKSRSVGTPASVVEELHRVYEFTKNKLHHNQIAFEESFYSKLTFLKDYGVSNSTKG